MGALVAPRQSCKGSQSQQGCASQRQGAGKRKVEHRQLEVPEMDEDPMLADEVRCQVCGSDEDGDVMLLCDHCDQGYHTFCIHLDAVPEGDWYCHRCSSLVRATQHRLRQHQLSDLGRPAGRASLIQPPSVEALQEVDTVQRPRRFRRLRRLCEDVDEDVLLNSMQESIA